MPLVTVWFTEQGVHCHLDRYCDLVHWNWRGDRMKSMPHDTASSEHTPNWCSGCAKPVKRWWEKP